MEENAVFKARMRFEKCGRAKFISHLDLMKAMQRSISRAGLPVWYTEGFNRHAYVSMALPLSTGYSSQWELMDFNFDCDSIPQDAIENMNAVMPEGLRVLEIYPLERAVKHIAYSEYVITYDFDNGVEPCFADDVKTLFAQDVIELVKRTKRSEKTVNIKEFIKAFEISNVSDNKVQITVINCAGNDNLSPEYITKAIEKYLPQYKIDGKSYHRTRIFDNSMEIFK